MVEGFDKSKPGQSCQIDVAALFFGGYMMRYDDFTRQVAITKPENDPHFVLSMKQTFLRCAAFRSLD